MTTHLKNDIYKKLTGWDLTKEFSATKQTLCHWITPLATDPFTNMLVLFMPGAFTAVDPFLDRIPRELHEQYMTDFLTELMKLSETNKTTDDIVISYKYGLIVAFARKLWNLQPSIGRCGHTRQISETRLVTVHPTTHTNTSHKIVHTVLAWNKKDYMHTPNNILNHTWISICLYFCFKLLFTYN